MHWTKLLKILWASPCSAIGLTFAALLWVAGGKAVWSRGALEVTYRRSKASCGTQPDTVVFTTTGGSATCGNETVKIVDGQKKPDTIQVIATNPANNVPASSLVSGNFTIHP